MKAQCLFWQRMNDMRCETANVKRLQVDACDLFCFINYRTSIDRPLCHSLVRLVILFGEFCVFL